MEQPLPLSSAIMSANLRLEAALADAADGQGPLTIALMRVLIEASDEGQARAALARIVALRRATSDAGGAARLAALEDLWNSMPQAWQVVRSTIEGIAHEHHDASPEGALLYWAAAFDRLAANSPEASVALYSLGSPALLAEATDEVVARMVEWDLAGPDRDVLDIGCGIGRFLVALAPRVRSILGLDISRRMVAEAQTRCAGRANVRVAQTSGRDLSGVGSGTFNLVLAADVFPYIVQAGGSLVPAAFAEIARVLRPKGQALVLNYSYRGDVAVDRRDSRAAAEAAGLVVERDGTRDLSSWDAATFLFRKRDA